MARPPGATLGARMSSYASGMGKIAAFIIGAIVGFILLPVLIIALLT